ncbi:MAG TPA: flagellar hook-associated protein FlgK [Caulobacteraceae bacterium]|nr:flagellar hook-associated protein FlgK [Caulobacteraceae bacterium]
MSLNSIISSAVSGMGTAQLGLNTVSDNVANLNTTGYSRKVVDQNALVLAQLGMGVSTSGIELAANQFLQNASLSASASAGSLGAVSNLLDQAQALFGNPSSATSYFNQLSQVFTDFGTAANDPTSTIDRTQVVSDLNQFLNQSQGIATSLGQLGAQADSQIGSDVAEANQLLSQIASLNTDIATATSSGADPTDSQNAQNELINQLSSLMDVQVQTTSTGGVLLKTQGGATLVGQAGASTLSYTASATAATAVQITQPGATQKPVALQLASGEMQGLLNMRNTILPGAEDQLSEFVTQAVNAINAAHNASSAVPPPQTLTGQNVGQTLPAAVSGFSGKTNIAIVNNAGQLQETVTIDFSAGTMSVNGGAGVAFTPANFLTSLDTALGTYGSASFNNGALSISATTSGNGVAIADDSTTPSSKVGQGFSQYFGLNNLISSSQITNYNTGLAASAASGFPAGQTLTLAVSNASGVPFTDVTITTPGGTVQNLIDTLNSASSGVGLYGQFSLDSHGALTFTPATAGGASISVVKDNTASGTGGPSVSQLFGIGSRVRADRTYGYSIRSDIQAAPSNLALAQLDLANATSGQPVLAVGDNSGALALANAGASTMNFAAAGSLGAMSTSIDQYAAEFAGALGNQASAADEAKANAQSAQTAASNRLQSITGVNLNQELVNMSTYQHAFSASARVVTAANDMFNALMTMMG